MEQKVLLGILFIHIPDGIANIGKMPDDALARSNERSLYQRYVKSFWISSTPITQSQYNNIMGYNPSYNRIANIPILRSTNDYPVENVSWYDALNFCNRLCALLDMAESSIRLPFEFEWEYACRGSSKNVFQDGNRFNSIQGNIQGLYPYGCDVIGPTLNRTCKVGQYPPNKFGLYDMHGNVWEWCMDEYTTTSGIKFPSARILKGGAWNCYARFCRTSYRCVLQADKHYFDAGFRIVLSKS